jgi:hypothetical protein
MAAPILPFFANTPARDQSRLIQQTAMLRRLEWSGRGGSCPVCGWFGMTTGEHDPDGCELHWLIVEEDE